MIAQERPSGRDSIFLIGPMGAGKSAIGRALAKRLKRDFHDSDAEIQRRTGVDIAYIFEREDEAGFRARERQVIADLVRLPGIVLATGGGVVLDPDNRADLAANGLVIYLQASPQQQLARTRLREHRPLLATPDPAGRLAALLEQRGPLYRGIADMTVDTDGQHVHDVVRTILRQIDA